MPVENSRFVSICPVLLLTDIRKTVQFYTEKLGFVSALHYDKIENFATIYRDDIEFIIVQARQGEVQANVQRYGAGEDAYIVPATVEGVDAIFAEFKAKGVKILTEPHLASYGSYEFDFEDCDGRQIGIGRIADRQTYFKHSEIKP